MTTFLYDETFTSSPDEFTFSIPTDLMPVCRDYALQLLPSTPRFRLRRALTEALRHVGAWPKPPTSTVTQIDHERGVITLEHSK